MRSGRLDRTLLPDYLARLRAAVLTLAVTSVVPAGAQVGEIFDPTGDSTGPGGTADLVSARIEVIGPDLRLEVRYAPGTFNPGGTIASFGLDTDLDPTTGSPGNDNQCSPPDNAIIGVDWALQVRSFTGTVRLLQFPGGCNVFAVVANTLAVEEVADGMNLTVPRELLGGDDGRLAFKVVSFTQTGPGSGDFTPLQDRMSNPGLAPGVVGGLPNMTPCVGDEMTACLLDGRFEVKVTMWNLATPPVLFPGRIQTYQGATSETDQSVSYYSFQDGNVEVFVKMVAACAHPSLPGFWLFAAGATNTETEILVRDTDTGQTRRIHNPRAHLFDTFADNAAFLDCP